MLPASSGGLRNAGHRLLAEVFKVLCHLAYVALANSLGKRESLPAQIAVSFAHFPVHRQGLVEVDHNVALVGRRLRINNRLEVVVE